MHNLLVKHQNEIGQLCRAYGIARLDVFGSAARNHDFDPQSSDVDFLLKLQPGRDATFTMTEYLEFRRALSQLLGYPVDLVMDGSIQNPYIRANIERSRELVHAA